MEIKTNKTALFMRHLALLTATAILIFPFIPSFGIRYVKAAITDVSGCSLSAVQAAVNSASSGDTVMVPSGTCTWSSMLTVTKAISLKGAGIGSSVITGGVDYSPSISEATKTFELSGFTFKGSGRKFEPDAPNATTPITGLKIHDNRFTGSTERALAFSGMEFGVIYNNTFDGNYISVSVIGAGDAGWNYNHAFGSANYPYFEDNTFNNGTGAFVFETGQGGRIAFRHNNISGYACSGCEVFDMHGDQGDRGTVSTEIYHNDINVGSSGTYRWAHHRGGQAIIANNTINRRIGFDFTEYRAWGGNGICEAYPAHDQINNSYYFNNIAGGSPQNPTFTNGGDPGSCGGAGEDAYLVLNRDYWLPTSGPDANRPATCTANGNTYYGATDTDILNKCTATNTWTAFFTPYTYPHPLRGSTATPIIGDINLDHIVNSIDYSILNSDWFTSNAISDLNTDGIVNAIDYSLLNANWFKTW